jgi:hypothetical protein
VRDRALDHLLALCVQSLPLPSGLVVCEHDQTSKLGGLTDLLLAEQAVLCEVALEA